MRYPDLRFASRALARTRRSVVHRGGVQQGIGLVLRGQHTLNFMHEILVTAARCLQESLASEAGRSNADSKTSQIFRKFSEVTEAGGGRSLTCNFLICIAQSTRSPYHSAALHSPHDTGICNLERQWVPPFLGSSGRRAISESSSSRCWP